MIRTHVWLSARARYALAEWPTGSDSNAAARSAPNTGDLFNREAHPLIPHLQESQWLSDQDHRTIKKQSA